MDGLALVSRRLATWAAALPLLALCAVGAGAGCLAEGPNAGDAGDEVGQPGLATYEGALTAKTPITIGGKDLSILRYGNYVKEYLTWDPNGSALGGCSLSATYKVATYVGTTKATKVNDPWNTYPGQCVSLVKSLSGRTSGTSTWAKGANVMASGSVPIGTAIATFSGSTYYGHVGFYCGAVTNGFVLCDENWSLNGLVKKHTITKTGSGSVSDAGAYYVVLAP